jgi:hypothetical protein
LSVISISIICDGTSDFCLQNIIEWITDNKFPDQSFRLSIARELTPAHDSLDLRLRKAAEAYEPDILICHRDAENMTHASRVLEINTAKATSNISISVVPAVPVRMTESWLLTNEYAIRSASNNKNGDVPLPLPKYSEIENLSDPKTVLFDALKKASSLNGRRLQKFDVYRARSRVASLTTDFSMLQKLNSFIKFEAELINAIKIELTKNLLQP